MGSVESALIAQTAGAYRVELCAGLPEGGTTPSIAQIELARKLLTIQIYAMVRPRGGDFLYSDLEFETMRSEIDLCGRAGCDGVAIGLLNADGSIDADRCSVLVEMAAKYSMGVTFHRAFDRCNDLSRGLEDVIGTGCERILTSGGRNTALQGAAVIRELTERSAGRIIIMPGSGIDETNIARIVRECGTEEFHGKFQSRYGSGMIYKNTALSDQQEEYTLFRTDMDKVRKVIDIANREHNIGIPKTV